jgi:hypothetical protein
MDRWLRRCKQRFQLAAPGLEWLASQIAVSPAQQVKEHKRRWSLLREQIHTRSGRMEAQLQRFEVQSFIPDDDNLSVEDAAPRQRRV